MLKAILAAAGRAMALMAAVTLIPIIEGGKLVWRAARAVLAPQPPSAAAEAEEAFEAEAAKPAPAPAPLSPAEAWGRAALHHMQGSPPEASAALDDAARGYLDGLSVEQQIALSRHDTVVIGRHLLRERPLPGLPRPMTPTEHRGIEATRAGAAATVASQSLSREAEMRDFVLAVLQELIDEPMPRRG
ncbi:hypothetical protein Maq22A_c23550 [Methylobacterium aquaticum]|uniref:Uncharacterized protein n=2 Tax=Methylobacterium aquaticum TaxID=270351 RepID=A0A0C6FQT7_9HYPH|nr:hypothetical protein Maq22A_c23550 [Methylobacterium aquaticum]